MTSLSSRMMFGKLVFGMIVGGVAGTVFWWISGSGIYLSRGEIGYYLGILTGIAAIWLSYSLKEEPRRTIAEFDRALGYWRLGYFGEGHCVCFATSVEKKNIPEPSRGSPDNVRTLPYIGRINCIVEDELWVWREEYGPSLNLPEQEGEAQY